MTSFSRAASLGRAVIFGHQLHKIEGVLPAEVDAVALLVGHDGRAPGVEVGQHDGHLLRRELDGIGIEALPQLTELAGRHGVELRLTPHVAGHLSGQAAEGKSPLETLVFQQRGLLLSGRNGHGEARAPQLLLRTEIVHESCQKQASLPAEAVEVAAAASLEGDGDRQRRSDDLVIFLSDVDIFRPGELFQSRLDELGAVAAFFLPQCHDCRLIRRLHQTIH